MLSLFFVVPVALVVLVSFFRYQMLVGIVPEFTIKNYVDLLTNPTTWTLYLSTIKFTLIVLVITFVLGFWIAYFLVFHVRNLLTAIGLFLRLHGAVLDLEHHPHDFVAPGARHARG